MRRRLCIVFAVFMIAFGASFTSFAKTPPEVMALYKEYHAALEKGDKATASDAAYEAWQLAEKTLGDHKTTGDLAVNFAQVDPSDKGNLLKLYKKRTGAYKRAVELAHLYEDDPQGIEIDRRLKLAAHGVSLGSYKKGKHIPAFNLTNFKDLEKAITAYGKTGTTYDADYHSILARFYERRQDYDTALVHANKAIEIFNTRTDDLTSAYFYFVKLFKANILSGNGDKIPAALQYQEVMQNLEGALEPDHPFIKRAFTGWMLTRSELDEAGRLDEAEAAGLCQCWPYENYKDKPVPLLRVPPMMPRNARRSGHVNVIFDVNDNGRPVNIRAMSTTDKAFVKPALKSIEKWQYSPRDAETDPDLRKEVASKITFRLTARNGRVIPEAPLFILE